MNFREIAEAAGYDPAKATGKVSIEVLREAAKRAMESGEPIAVTERRVRAKKQAMLDDFGRALEHTMYFIDLSGYHGAENLEVLREEQEG